MSEPKPTYRTNRTPRATPPTPTQWSAYDPHLVAADLRGRAFKLTIRAVDTVEVYDRMTKRKTHKPILHFKETHKYLILSPTNRKTLTKTFGNECAACIGKAIGLKAVEVEAFGEVTNPLRIFIPSHDTAQGRETLDSETGEIVDEARDEVEATDE